MADIFRPVAQKLIDLGILGFLLPWLITAAIFYGLLRKSKLFDSILINAILALATSFFLWGFLVGGTAVDIGAPLATFMAQGSIIIIIIIFGLIAASSFYPELNKTLGETFKTRSAMYIMIAVFFILFFTSGLYRVFIPEGSLTGPNADVYTLIVILAVLIIGLFILVGVQSTKKSE